MQFAAGPILTDNAANASLQARRSGCILSDEGSPLVSVVMATYNAADALELTMESILKQNFKSYEMSLLMERRRIGRFHCSSLWINRLCAG